MVAADGDHWIKKANGYPAEVKDFGKTVIVCKMDHEKEHEMLLTNASITAELWQYCRWLKNAPLLLQYRAIRLMKY